MKKITTIILSVLLIALTFVSCDNATKAVQDELAEVTLSTQADSRSLTVSNPLEELRAVNWFYIATKVSERQFNYGETTSETSIILYPGEGQSKQILTLSQGKWKFELFGKSKNDNTLLYHGITPEVLILKSNGLNQITVEVSPYTNALGQISFSNVKLVKADGTKCDPNYLEVTGPENYSNTINDFTGTKDLPDLKAGQYTVTVAWKDTINEDNPYTEAVEPSYDVVIASETIVVTVYGGRTTTISGNISEETGSGTIDGNIEIKTEATQTKTVLPNTPTTFTVNVAPANSVSSSKVENTTVTFAVNDLPANQVAELKVEVKDIDTAVGSFVVSNGSAVAGISLTLTYGENTQIENFENAVIETYIAKGLSNVQVMYNGDGEQPELITPTTSSGSSSHTTNYYESDTGKLVFTTTHFSEYYVVADEVVALNTNTNTAYATLADAINQANEGETVSLLKDVTLSEDLKLGSGQRGVNLNLNGKTIDGGTYKVYTTDGDGTTNIFGKGTIKNNNTVDSSNYAALYIPSGSTVVIDDVTLKGYYGVYVNGNLTIKKATIKAVDCGIAANNSAQVNVGSATEHDITVTASNGNCISTQAAAGKTGMLVNVYGGTFTSFGIDWQMCPVYWASHGTLNVYGGTFTSDSSGNVAAIYQKNGEVNIYGGTFRARNGVKLGAEQGDCTEITLNISGGTITGTRHAALYYKTTSAGSNCTSYNINISGGKFAGLGSYDAIYAQIDPVVITPSVKVTGGTFSTDPLKYVPFGYDVEQVDGKYVVSTSTELTVNDADQLMKFAASVNAGNDYAGKTIILNRDIDLNTEEWTPIGQKAGNKFAGVFDGNNKTISGLSITENNIAVTDTAFDKYVGLFGAIENGTVKNLTVSGSVTGINAAGIVARMESGTIENCISNVTVVGTDNGKAGGIVCLTNTGNCTIKNCINNGSVKGDTEAGVGGIAAYVNANTTIYGCTNNAEIGSNTDRYSGGIAGYVKGSDNILIKYCTNTNNVTAYEEAGGIVGIITKGDEKTPNITNCLNRGAINARQNGNGGGIAGSTYKSILTDCKNTASVYGKYAGGVIGNDAASTITNCSGGTADITSPAHTITFTDHSFTLSVDVNKSSGRIIGAHMGAGPGTYTVIILDDTNGDSKAIPTVGICGNFTTMPILKISSGTFYGDPLAGNRSTIILESGAKWGERAAGTYTRGGVDESPRIEEWTISNN